MNENKKMFHALRNLALVTQLGLSMIVPMVGGAYLGYIMDLKFKTGKLLFFIFLFLGIGAAFLNLFKLTMKSIDKKDKDS
ncbi:MAG: AtpZ/AtpI family protein [Peptostreptococcaceae bacterium]|jgi:F0F1-type ATP synthase assembly protein I|nr:AtpZ/AtpI family protein [Peptostreptococcaceae bacterium]